MNIPQIQSYCDNTTQANAQVVTIGAARLFFSYQTPVAVDFGGTITVRKNDWGPTTGKHLNAIDGGARAAKETRVTSADFELALIRAFGG